MSEKLTIVERFKTKFKETNGCWEWKGTVLSGGYGQFYVSGTKKVLAHRYSYELVNGPILNDMCVDHLCKNRRCINPNHLRIVTREENTLLNSEGVTARNKKKTYCIRGHEFIESNTYYSTSSNGKRGRHCKTCNYMHTVNRRKRL